MLRLNNVINQAQTVPAIKADRQIRYYGNLARFVVHMGTMHALADEQLNLTDMNGVSAWAAGASSLLAGKITNALFTTQVDEYSFSVVLTPASLWIVTQWPAGGKLVCRAACSPEGDLTLGRQTITDHGLHLQLRSSAGTYDVEIAFTKGTHPVLRYTTKLCPGLDLLMPFWPRDLLFPGKDGAPGGLAGKVHVQQQGTRSGIVYATLTRPKAGAVLYLQNLTALANYCNHTETSCADAVGGTWPELGLALPPTKDKPLPAGESIILCDALLAFESKVPENEAAVTRQYLDLLAAVYMEMPKPATIHQDWPAISEKGLKDLLNYHGCWSQVQDQRYFNAYVCDYDTPPEIMVQLAVLLPLLDYVEWSSAELPVIKEIKAGLPAFYDEKLHTIMRWLPAAAGRLKGEEEQKRPLVMDSWYLHHPLLNLSRMALKGDKTAEQLFLGSLDFAIKVARHFKYQWPVFYKMDTLEVIKAETQPGKGGEKDVAGLYAHILLQAWELTGENKYLHEAEKAAKTLLGMGFDLFYQANNTAFSAGALLRLFKATGDQLYLELSYNCLANLFRNVRLWDCNYGHGTHFPSFFSLFPLNDAPYTAAYEEQEVFCALHDYLKHAEGMDLLPSATLLITEYIRYMVNRAVFYYPPMLPGEILAEKTKMGAVNKHLWIALEDLHDGWEKNGEVGQEVYGAGNAFGILPRHYHHVPGKEHLIFCEYPLVPLRSSKPREMRFRVTGDPRLSCRLLIITQEKQKLTAITVKTGVKPAVLAGRKRKADLEYTVYGKQVVRIQFDE